MLRVKMMGASYFSEKFLKEVEQCGSVFAFCFAAMMYLGFKGKQLDEIASFAQSTTSDGVAFKRQQHNGDKVYGFVLDHHPSVNAFLTLLEPKNIPGAVKQFLTEATEAFKETIARHTDQNGAVKTQGRSHGEKIPGQDLWMVAGHGLSFNGGPHLHLQGCFSRSVWTADGAKSADRNARHYERQTPINADYQPRLVERLQAQGWPVALNDKGQCCVQWMPQELIDLHSNTRKEAEKLVESMGFKATPTTIQLAVWTLRAAQGEKQFTLAEQAKEWNTKTLSYLADNPKVQEVVLAKLDEHIIAGEAKHAEERKANAAQKLNEVIAEVKAKGKEETKEKPQGPNFTIVHNARAYDDMAKVTKEANAQAQAQPQPQQQNAQHQQQPAQESHDTPRQRWEWFRALPVAQFIGAVGANALAPMRITLTIAKTALLGHIPKQWQRVYEIDASNHNEVKAFLTNAQKTPRWMCHAAALEAVQSKPFMGTDRAFRAATRAFQKARRPKTEVRSGDAVIVNNALDLTPKERQKIEKIARRAKAEVYFVETQERIEAFRTKHLAHGKKQTQHQDHGVRYTQSH